MLNQYFDVLVAVVGVVIIIIIVDVLLRIKIITYTPVI